MNGKSGKFAKVIFFTKIDTINSSEMKTTAKPIKDGKRMSHVYLSESTFRQIEYFKATELMLCFKVKKCSKIFLPNNFKHL